MHIEIDLWNYEEENKKESKEETREEESGKIIPQVRKQVTLISGEIIEI